MPKRRIAYCWKSFCSVLLALIIVGFPASPLQAEDGFVVLNTTVGEDNNDLTNCLEETLQKNRPQDRIVPAREFKDSLFPFFEARTAPKSAKALSGLLEKPSIQSRVDVLGVRYVLAVYSNTELSAWSGDIFCSEGGCLGAQTRDVSTNAAIAVWDLQDPESSSMAEATASGTDSFGALFFLPLWSNANTEVHVCQELMNQVHAYLDGKPSGVVRAVAADGLPEANTMAINKVFGAYKEPILARVLEGCRDPMIPNSRCLSVAVSPDGKTIAAGSSINKIWLFNTDRQDTPTIILEGGSSYFFYQGNSHVESMAFSPDGRRLIISGSVDHKQATVWDLESRKPLVILGKGAKPKQSTRLSRGYSSVAISPDGKLVATGSNLGKAEIWEIDSGDLLYALEAATAAEEYLHPTATAFHPGNALLATFSNNLVRIWNLTDGRMLASQQGANDIENSTRQDVLFSPDGKTLAAHHCTGVTVWKIQDSPELGQPGSIHLDDKITIPLSVSNEAQNSHACEGQLAFSPDQKFLYAQISAPVGLVKINLDTYMVEGIYQWPDDPLLDLAITPDGEYVVTPYGTGIKLWSM